RHVPGGGGSAPAALFRKVATPPEQGTCNQRSVPAQPRRSELGATGGRGVRARGGRSDTAGGRRIRGRASRRTRTANPRVTPMRALWRELEAARVYDLAQPLEAATPTSPNHPPFRMALLRRHGDMVRADGSSAANELITMGGHTGTHVDALCHVSAGMKLHGRLDAVEAARGGRFQQLGVETIAPMLCRGVLLDGPPALGLEVLEAAHPITAEELEQTCQAEGVEVGEGDAVLIRSGWAVGRYHDAVAYSGWATGVPGPDESAARWLAARRIHVTGADTIAYEGLAPAA